tara:strand:- start:274 stop:972 length:699 start_codon:yes stop_codon:yes gene_type:complete
MAERVWAFGRAYLLQWMALVFSGVIGSLGFVKLVDKVFGWDSLGTISRPLYQCVDQLLAWWDFAAVDGVRRMAEFIGLNAETDTVAAAVSLLLLSTVGLKHFQFGFGDALNKRERRRPGRKRKDGLSQAQAEFGHWLRQKWATCVQFFKSDTWIAGTMLVAYLLIVLAVNFDALNWNPDTLKGMAYTVLIYSGVHAILELRKRQSYLRYVVVMIASTAALFGLSWFLQVQAV